MKPKTSISAAIILCVILTCTVLSFAFTSTQANAATALHVSGSQILDASGKTVILRGIGRAGDIESASGMWSSPGSAVFAWDQKWHPITNNIPLMDATFKCYQQNWHVNMIRMFINVNWYWQDNVVPSVQDPANYPDWTTPISYREYVTTVVAEAAKHGIYVDICPYQLNSGYEDAYAAGAQGLPLSGWDQAGQDFLSTTNLPEQEFWTHFWTLVASNLKDYPNAIFEAWNEPENLGVDPITPQYLTYLVTMYNAVRGYLTKTSFLCSGTPATSPPTTI